MEIRDLTINIERYNELSRNISSYVQENHDIETIIPQYEKVLHYAVEKGFSR